MVALMPLHISCVKHAKLPGSLKFQLFSPVHLVLQTYGQTWSVSISRAGDYLLNTWLRVLVPQLTIGAQGAVGAQFGAVATLAAMNGAIVPAGGAALNNELAIAWVQNLMHNLVAECCITFNDLVAARFDSVLHLDFWSAFTVPASKQARLQQYDW